MTAMFSRVTAGTKQAAVARTLLSLPFAIPASIVALIWLSAASPLAPLFAVPPLCLLWIWAVDAVRLIRGADVVHKTRPWYFVFVAGCIAPLSYWAIYLHFVTE
jgi:ABC-type sugar transport system permease subunit